MANYELVRDEACLMESGRMRCRRYGSHEVLPTTIASLRADIKKFLATHTHDASKVYLVSKGSTYTRLWSHADWHAHLSVWRYARHIFLWPTSTIAWRIFPVCCIVVCWALAVKELAKSVRFRLELPFTCGLLFGQAITLLLTLRTNQSMARLQEARAVFNKVVVTGRELGSLVSCYLKHEGISVIIARYVCMVGWTLKHLVRGEADESNLKIMLRDLIPIGDVEFVETSVSMPLALVRRARMALSEAVDRGAVDRSSQRTIEIKLGLLGDLVGACEKILHSPSPPAYTRHTSRVLLVFLFIVPMGLADLNLPTHFLVLASAFITYLLVGIEEIGVELEEPFRWLPLQQLCSQLLEDVLDEFSDAPPLPLPAADVPTSGNIPKTAVQNQLEETMTFSS
ncbi:hypothetical protein CTAYLR_000885 [Chrysophaeum taylorii]|uniref:Uncharacterized protein n=1 Tax=Chrysophaeum taylorii TaxID=2483200 RepID=A0AAD7UF62_9STRA|nr:hypothetical protein CTAYLR_000885 [Chrysophaeum taylorii]